MRLAGIFPMMAGCLVATSCSDGVDPSPATGVRAELIAYGEPDTTHKEVVFVFQEIGSSAATCGGTIIAVKGETGILLTAAHCVAKYSAPGKMVVPPEPGSLTSMAVVMDDNYMIAKPAVKEIFEVALHPEFDGLSHRMDFAMVRFGKVDPSTPVIAAMTASDDQLQVGTMLDLVGYGATESSKSNSIRRHIEKPIAELTSDYLKFDQSGTTGGACEGDSGGPALTLDTPSLVAGVETGGTSCTGVSSYGRVSAAYEGFIKPFVDNATGEITCTECFHSSYQSAAPCSDVFQTCFKSQDCTDYGNCVKACDNDSSCSFGCAQGHTEGASLYATAMECLCTKACAVECETDAKCQKPPVCGLAIAAQACDKCADDSCCEQEQACAGDQTCAQCAGATTPDPSCAGSPAYLGLLQCLGSSCGSDCGKTSCGFAGEATCKACVETSCCEASLGCSLESACEECRSAAQPASECDAIAAWAAWQSCVAESCAKECAGTGDAGAPQVESSTVGGGCGFARSRAASQFWAVSLLLIGAKCVRRRRRR